MAGTLAADFVGSQSTALELSTSGLGTGFADDGSGTAPPVLRDGGAAQRISTGLTDVSPTGVNARGEVVGVDPSSLDQGGWQWRPGKLTRLRATSGAWSGCFR